MYRTVIIEDDPVITQLNRQYVEKDSRFTVVQTFSAAHPALFWLRNNLVDLIILDMYMPQDERPGAAAHSPGRGRQCRCDHGHLRRRCRHHRILHPPGGSPITSSSPLAMSASSWP